MIQRPCFKHCYEPIVLAEDVCAVISEVGEYLLHGKIYPRILPLMDGRRTVDEIVEEAADGEALELYYYHLLQLEKHGFLIENGQRNVDDYDFWALALDSPGAAHAGEKLRIHLSPAGEADPAMVTQYLEEGALLDVSVGDFSSAGKQDDGLWVVLVKDYLEPQLEAVNRLARETGTRWIPFKPFGVMPWMGPVFEPGAGACWECMALRLRGHRDVESFSKPDRAWNLSRGEVVPSVRMACDLLSIELCKLAAQPGENDLLHHILTFDFRKTEFRKHRVMQLLQCPRCGDSGAGNKKIPKEPLRLVSRIKSSHNDGGHRIRPAEETLQTLENEISPISGLIGRVTAISREANKYGHNCLAFYSAPKTLSCFRKDNPDSRGRSCGKGRTSSQSRVSAIAEAFERYSAVYRGDEPMIRAAWNDVEDIAIPAENFFLLSETQWETHRSRCREEELIDPYNRSEKCDWTPAWSMVEKRWKLVPASLVYTQWPGEKGHRYLKSDTTGLAAGSCLEEAITQALFEIVERDAHAIWWYNLIRAAQVDPGRSEDPEVEQLFLAFQNEGWDLNVLDVTTDLEIPAFAAIAVHQNNHDIDPLFGGGAHFDPRIALSRTLGEVAPLLKGPQNIYRANPVSRQIHGKPLGEMPYMSPNPEAAVRPLDSFSDRSTSDLLTDIETLVGLFAERGMDTLVVDLSRADVPLRVVRVFVPGMRPMWPNFAPGRMFDVPVLMDWKKRRPAEEEFNPMNFFQNLNRAKPADALTGPGKPNEKTP